MKNIKTVKVGNKSRTETHAVSTGNETQSTISVSEILKHHTLRLALQAYEHFCKPDRRMVIVYAHAHLYKDSPRHALVVKKAPGTLHAGLFNLPGGYIDQEQPDAAALRKLKDECGVEGTSPQLVGAILPSGRDAHIDKFIVYIYRCILAPGSQLAFPSEQPASWELIETCRNGKWVPGLSVILPLLASGVMGFVVQDNDDVWLNSAQHPQSQHVVTFLPHAISDAATQTKQRFTT